MKNRVEVLHGVNLDMLGRRDPEHYGTLTLAELPEGIRDEIRDYAKARLVELGWPTKKAA